MRLVLDSGAFSAWNVGAQIDLDDYIAYIYRNMEWVSAYVNLDVIPGQPGRTPTEAEVEESARASWANMEYMQGMGLDPIPVFHQGERFYWLERMFEADIEYIGISPANDRSTEAKIEWLDRVFNYLCDDDGNAKVKTHAFGVTAIDIVSRYPWHTVDSTTWLVAGSRFGLLRVPYMGRDGKWDMTRRLSSVRISKEAPLVEGHFIFLSNADKAAVVRFIEEAGSTLAEVIDDRHARNLVNAYVFKMVSDAHQVVKFKRRQLSLFQEH